MPGGSGGYGGYFARVKLRCGSQKFAPKWTRGQWSVVCYVYNQHIALTARVSPGNDRLDAFYTAPVLILVVGVSDRVELIVADTSGHPRHAENARSSAISYNPDTPDASLYAEF